MEVIINNIGTSIKGIAQRIEDHVVDKLIHIDGRYPSDNEDLAKITKVLKDEVKKLDFIGDILAGIKDKDENRG